MVVERPALERRLLDVLEAGRIAVVLGGCASGRTSLLMRLEHLLGDETAQYLDFGAAATTPERCFNAVTTASRLKPGPGAMPPAPSTPRAAFDGLMAFFDRAAAPRQRQAVFLLDDVFDIRTFENFPGLRQVQHDLISRLSSSPAGFVLASRFTARSHRLLRDAPARFEVVHIPPLSVPDVELLARRFDSGRTVPHAAAVAALSGGQAGYAHIMLEALSGLSPSADPVAALAALFAPDSRLTARCRESYEFRLHRARGYGALKAILGILADDEPQNLTEIAQRLLRTPGSTKDYLSWLEDVDLIAMQGKRYSYVDPLLRLYVRLYARPVPPTDAQVVHEVRTYALSRLPALVAAAGAAAAAVAAPALDRAIDGDRPSGIIEID